VQRRRGSSDPDASRSRIGAARPQVNGKLRVPSVPETLARRRREAKAALRRACFSAFGRGCVALSQLTPDRERAQELLDLGCAHGMRGPTGDVFTNVGLPELAQPLKCSRPSR
jgi:hypothetical protein